MYDPRKPYKNEILGLIEKTWETPYVRVENSVVDKKFSYPEYHHTDGIGSKGVYHWREKSFKNAVIDALAMNLNDLAMMRSHPYAVVDHLFLPEDDEKAIIEIISYLVEECKDRFIAITGGETAIHDNMEGMELSMTMLGFVKNPKPNKLEEGDVLIGIESNGIHSNGFTRIREVFKEEYKPDFIKPTNIYLDLILGLDNHFDVHGMMHITGGAFTKLKSILPSDLGVMITNTHGLKPHEIFFELYERGVTDEEMYKTFNNGIGFILSVAKDNANEVLKRIKEFKADVIGEVRKGKRDIRIQSMFSDKKVVF